MKNFTFVYYTLSFLTFQIYSSYGQTSVVQDTKGESGLALGTLGVIAVNAANESISFSYGVPLKKPTGVNAPPLKNPWYIGASVKAKGKTGLASVVNKGKFQYDGNFGLFALKDFNQSDNGINQIFFSTDLSFSQFKLFDSLKVYSDQIFDKNKFGYKLTIGYNHSGRFINNIPFILGVTLNGGNRDKTVDLKTVDIYDYITLTDPATKQSRIVQSNKASAYKYVDYKDNLMFGNLNIDIGPQFFNQYLLLLHSRLSFQNGRKGQWNPAVGLYFTKSGAPLEVVAGIQLQVLDYTNTAGAKTTIGERTVLNVVAGFSF